MHIAQSVPTRTRYPALGHLLEAAWLAAAALVPLVVAHEQWMVGFVQMAKIGVFRTIVVVLLTLATVKWALDWKSTAPDLATQVRGLWAHPARLLFLGAGAVLLATLISVALSPIKSISIWGIDPGWDSYGLVSLACYLVVFGVIAAHLRTAAQVERLIWTVIVSALLISFYGIGQHFGIDPFRTSPGPTARANLSFGNPIFAGSYLVMTIPLTAAMVLSIKRQAGLVRDVLLGIALVGPQMVAMVFTESRGPWVGLAFGLLVFIALLYRRGTLQQLLRGVAVVGLSGALAFLLSLVPVGDGPSDSNVVERIESIGSGLAGGMNNRWTIWTTAGEVFVTSPWVDTEEFSEMPELMLRPLRPVFGYGPDMFGYAYPLGGETTYTFELATHGHNFVVHTLLELGVLGVAAYLFLAGAAALLLHRLFKASRNGAAPQWYVLLLVGLSGALAGRIVEQIPGKAQVSDLMLSWMFAGLLVGLTLMLRTDAALEPEPAPLARRRRSRRVGVASPAFTGPMSVPRVMGALLLTVVLTVFWYAHVAMPVSAAFVTADAQRAGNTDTQQAVDGYERAIARYPSLPVARYRLAQVVFQVSQNMQDTEQKETLLGHAHAQMEAVLARNPMDHRAVSRAAEYHREMGVQGQSTKEESLQEALLLVELMPGFWQSHSTLAWSYIRLGDVDQGLQAVERAKELDNGTRETYLIYYMEAVALTDLGRTADALAAVERSLDLQPSGPAEQLHAQLGG